MPSVNYPGCIWFSYTVGVGCCVAQNSAHFQAESLPILDRNPQIHSIAPNDKRHQANRHFQSRRIRTFADFKSKADSWDRERRVIARCDYSDDGLETRYLVTNITKPVARLVYEQIYCRRQAWQTRKHWSADYEPKSRDLVEIIDSIICQDAV